MTRLSVMPAPKSPRRPRRVRTALRLIAGLTGLLALGTLALALPGMTTRPLAPRDLLFTATSALAVTGFPPSPRLAI